MDIPHAASRAEAPPPGAQRPPRALPRGLSRGLVWAAVVGALGAVFLLYTQPVVLATLADQLWACFN